MPHKCILKSENEDNMQERSCWSRLKSVYVEMIIISAKNPLMPFYFRSESSLKEEKLKQLTSKHIYIIHPLSRFRQFYDIYVFLLYLLLLITKPVDGSIGRHEGVTYFFPRYRLMSLILDILSWFDITMKFFMGYVDRTTKAVVMEPKMIARNYVFSIFFITDVLSSIPRYSLYYYETFFEIRRILGLQNIFCALKYVRLLTEVRLVSKLSVYFGIRSRTVVFLFSSVLLFSMVLHFSTCLLIAVPRLVKYYFAPQEVDASRVWLLEFQGIPYHIRYVQCVFKSSAFLLGIRLNLTEKYNKEDFFVVVATYVVGKVLIASTWIVIAMTILNSRCMHIKFRQLMNQLDEYMRQKQLPMDLRSRITTYYEFKYQRTFFKEELINSILSEGLRKDINIHICRSLIANVSLFADLTPHQVSDVVALLIPEIFLPNDILIQSGSHGDAMYFLSSGTVAVYTHSGKEMCHLQDGAYFGEICLVLRDQLRTATVIAIEICQVYRLKKKDFRKSIMKNKYVYKSIISNAEQRLKDISKMEENYKKTLFEQKFTKAPEHMERSKSMVPT
ncbi:potassium/sodium hyperpolarization-activated cyclic nucleotide-gated channel 1 [Leptinotarsa decemlineata]|uniref:potassium/sodium hyperpolarization-activated cyclic nucleotide-gated channel 1 n=1 Tax=Leptinotarsa decemlineata TaxID=7539 RepID=UPI003D306D85